MDDGAKPGLAEQLTAALNWWRDAGVDADLRDEAQSWLAASAPEPPVVEHAPAMPRTATPPPAPAEPVPLDRSGWPADLDSFAPWWLSEPWLDGGQTQDRIAPRGAKDAELMIVVTEPEPGDTERLLSGAQGRLLDGMLAAMGVAGDAVYVASALPRHTPHADWAGLNGAGLGEVLRHHVSLVRPRRLIVFGANVLALLDTGPAIKPELFTKFHHVGGSVPLLALRELASLLERPRWKAEVWQHWLAWNCGDSAVPLATESSAT